MFTIVVDYTTTDECKEELLRMRRVQSIAIRTAYNQSNKGKDKKEIESLLNFKHKDKGLDSFFIRSATIKGHGDYKGDAKLNKVGRVYGSKKSLKDRSKDKITNEEWKNKRLQPLYIVGEANRNGNRKFDFVDEQTVEFKPRRGICYTLNLGSIKTGNRKHIKAAFDLANEGLIPITISMDDHRICFTIDESKVFDFASYKPKKDRYAGIDLNPNSIGISVFDKEKLIDYKLFHYPDLLGKGKSHNKLNHETHAMGHDIGKWLRSLKVDKLFMEELKFATGDSKKGKNFNRMTKNQWLRNKLTTTISKYFKIQYVNAAYTSYIGNMLHEELPDPIAASTAIAGRGYRLKIQRNDQYFPTLPSKEYLSKRLMEDIENDFEDWYELCSFVKSTGFRYRGSLPNNDLFRNFKSPNSYVKVY